MKRHLLKSLLLSVLMMLGVTNVQAENWSIDFAALGANYADKTGVTISESVATIGGTTMGTCTVGSEPLNEKFVLQTGTTWMIRKANGLYQGNGGGRAMGFLGCTKGQTITIVGTGDPNPSTNATLKSQVDNTYVYTVSEDGDVKFTPARYLYFTSVSVEDPSASAVNYTVKYVDSESKEIKDATTGSGEPNASITLTETEKASFINADNTIKYIYVSDDAEGKTIASDGSTVVTITFREAATYNYTLVSSLGGTITSGSYFEGETVNAPYPRYQLKDGVFYEAAVTNKEYRKPITLTADNASATVEYTAKDGANAVFFAEAENLEGMTNSTFGNIPVRASNALATIAEGDVKVTTLPRGKYKFHIGVFTSKSAYADFFLKFGIGADSLTATLAAVNMTEFTSEEFTLTQKAEISFWGGKSHADAQFDYIWIEKTGDVPFDPATAIVNADFASMEGWTPVVSGSFRDFGNGLIGTYNVRFSPATVDETHLATEYCIGLECRWNTNYASYTQDVELPAGSYKLSYDVENVNGSTTSANYDNLFKVTVGETVYTDKSTEWMSSKSAWTTHSIAFTLAENATVTISLGYGTGSNNISADNTPALYVSHLMLDTCDPLVEAKAEAIAALEALAPIGEGLFFYNQTDIDNAKAAVNTAETVEAVAAVAMPTPNAPAADKTYAFQLRLDGETPLYMNLAEGGITIAEEATALKFIAVEGAEGQYNLTNEDGTLFVGLAGGNAWTMSTLADQKAAWTFTALPDGAYRINNLVTAGRFVGTNGAEKAAGSVCYADKQTSNGNVDWLIAEYVAPVTDYTNYIVNADLSDSESTAWNTSGTKGYHSVGGIVTASTQAQFDFNQTIANLPAGKYKMTAKAAYRYGENEQAEYDAIVAEAETMFAKLYATVGTKTVDTLIQNRWNGASETNFFTEDASKVSTVNEKFVPNSTAAVKAWFTAGLYVNELEFNVPEEGAVTIGIVKTAKPEAGDFTVIGPWTLTRLGDAEVEPEPEPTPEPGTDMTAKIVNPSFETGDLTGWTVGNSSDTGVKPNSNATYTTEGVDGDYLFNTWWQGIPITQVVKGLPNGLYELKALMANDAITAGNKPGLYLLANGQHSAAFSSTNAGTFAEGTMQFYVTDGTATIGAVGGNADGTFNEAGYYWYKVDNFRLKYVEALPNIEDVEIPEGKMSIAAANAMITAKEAGDVVALIQAVNNAKSSIAAYAHVKELLDFVAEEAAKTNVYTAAAKEKFDSICTATLNGYNEGTISDADANAFNIGSRTEGLIPELFLSAYTSTVDGTPYINTWSVEGDNDGSEFKVPFYEYWVGDNDALAANTITAKVEGLEAGDYDVTAWVRVRMKNGVEAPATGITMQANDGEAVNVAAGDQVGESQFYLKEFTATGTVAADGVLNIKFNVAADNNISWLSFKNVKFEKKAAAEEFEEVKVTYALKADETHKSADVVEVKNEEEIVVATLTFGEAGGADFKAAKANAAVEGFEAFTEGNGVNGNSEGGTFYTIVPKFDGKVDVAVVLNADKSFYISEDGTVLADFDGITVSEKMYGTFTFDVKAEKAYKVYAAGTKLGFYGFNYTYKVAKQPEPQDTELALALNVERYPGMGYGVTEATVDFSEAKEFLGVEAITTDMLSIVNPDNTTISDYAPYDGWFNAEGAAESWASMNPGAAEEAKAGICVKFFQAIPEGKYEICDMNGADEVGKTYSVKWQLAANDKKVIYTINVTFVAAPEYKPEIVKTIDVPVYMTAETAYESLTAQFDAAEVATALNIASIADAKAYIVNVTTGNFVENATDGWRDANGDAAQWADATNGLCAKIQDPASGTIDYLGAHDANFVENATYTAKWGFVANEKAVVLNINITFKSADFMTRINSLKSDSQLGTIYNMNGQKVNKAQKGLYIINGKKVVVK